MNDPYPDSDFPWTFYFNGEVMPKWGARWSWAGISSFLQAQESWDEDVGHRDIYIIDCKIDHVGSIESAESDIFIYAIQQVLHILLTERLTIVANLADKPPNVYSDLVDAAFRMLELAACQRYAFWASGYDTDRVRLVEVMRRCQLASDSSEFTVPPHVRQVQSMSLILRQLQIRRLHRLAQSGEFDKVMRAKLHKLRAP